MSLPKISTQAILWAKSGLAIFISGGATSAGAAVSLATVKSMGVDVPTLNLKAISVVFLWSGCVGLFGYLKRSPLPGITEDADAPTTPPTVK